MIENLKQELADLTAKFDRLAEEDKLTPGKHQLALNAMGMDIQFLADEINSLETTDGGGGSILENFSVSGDGLG